LGSNCDSFERASAKSGRGAKEKQTKRKTNKKKNKQKETFIKINIKTWRVTPGLEFPS